MPVGTCPSTITFHISNVWRLELMRKYFDPESVAVIGAPGKTGVGAFNNVETMLRYGYKGRIYPVNPKIDEICGIKAYRSIPELPELVDMAIISVGRDRVPPLFEQCVEAGIKRIIIISQGFSDADEKGEKLQEQLVRQAQEHGVRIVGPNTMGVLNNFNGFSSGFVDMPVPETFSRVSLIAQTGVIQIATKDFAYHKWGKAIDIGNASDVDFVDALEYFEDDKETDIIAIHMEGMRRGREFLEIASRITLKKPIVVLKTGHSRLGAKAALSHSGSLVGEDGVFEAAFDRAGIIRVRNTAELRDALRALVCLKEMQGPNLGVVTVTGAGGIMAIDACEEAGLSIAQLPEGLAEKLTKGMPEWIHVGNPIDIWPIGMIGGDYPGAVKTALVDLMQSDDVDGVLVIIPAMNSPLHADIADLSGVVADVRRIVANDKPIAMWLYADDNLVFPRRYEAIEGVASFLSPEQAVNGLSVCYKYFMMRHRTPVSVVDTSKDYGQTVPVLPRDRAGTVLTGEDALNMLAAFDIPTIRGVQGKHRDELAQAAAELTFPLVLKLVGPDFLHKSEWGGVTVGIRDFEALETAYDKMAARVRQRNPNLTMEAFQLQEQVFGREILLGLKHDPQFGQVIVCGMGGIYTEVFRDVARELVPIDRIRAERMLRSLKIYPLLEGVRGEQGVDVASLIDALERLSILASEISDIVELDINPLMVNANGCTAVDARILW